jgi:tetratricopeptide (TPR) repeat protein
MRTCDRCRTPLALTAGFCSRCGEAVPIDGADLPLSGVLVQASRLLGQGEVDRAIALLTPHALTSEPDAQAIFALGAAYLQRGRYADALPLLAASLEHDLSNARAYAYLALAYLHTYQPAEARESINYALQLAPNDFVVNLKHGEFLARLGYFHESIVAVKQALEVPSPDASTLEFARRLLLFAQQKAPNTFTRPVNRFPRLPQFLRRSGARGRTKDFSASNASR